MSDNEQIPLLTKDSIIVAFHENTLRFFFFFLFLFLGCMPV